MPLNCGDTTKGVIFSMLRSLKETLGYKIETRDEVLGRVHDYYFDESFWAIRYLVVDTGSWLPGKRVLLSPDLLEEPDWASSRLPVSLAREELEEQPRASEQPTVSSEKEQEVAGRLQWPTYWVSDRGQGPAMVPMTGLDLQTGALMKKTVEERDRPALRSVDEVTGYALFGQDGRIGHVEDLIAEDKTWIVRYLVIDTRDWLPGGKKVLVSPSWVKEIDWSGASIQIDLTQKAVDESPEFDPTEAVNRQYEIRLYDYYGRPAYWKDDR